MATVRIIDGAFSIAAIDSAWEGTFDKQTSTKCVVVDESTSYGIELSGSNFTYSDSYYGGLESGRIKGITIFNTDGSVRWTMSGLSLNANEFNTAVSNAYSSNLSPLLTLLKDVPLIVSGGTLDDNFIGGQKNDKFFGGVGSDTFVGNGGRDQMDGGVGDYDIVNYSQENGGGGIKVNLTKNTVVDTYGSVDTVKNMELIVGTDEVDTFVGSKTAAYEAFSGRGGGDTINGGGGSHNTVRYDYDNDYGIDVNLAGNPDGTGYGKFGYYGDVDTLIGIQDIIATNGQDTLVGSAEANTFTGLSGSDDINGGLGIDTINYSFENGTQGVTVDLERYFAFDSYGYKDTLVSIEDVLGTGFRDLMKGSSGNNVLLGLGGNDSLKGLAGIDRLEGGTGNDRLAGGLGNDRLIGGDGYDDFVFDTALNAKTNVDRITDFAVASDSIALENAIFKSLKVGDLAAGAFYIGSAAHDASDRIIYNNKTGALLYDADGKGGQAAVQFATLDSNLKLTADHFDIF